MRFKASLPGSIAYEQWELRIEGITIRERNAADVLQQWSGEAPLVLLNYEASAEAPQAVLESALPPPERRIAFGLAVRGGDVVTER